MCAVPDGCVVCVHTRVHVRGVPGVEPIWRRRRGAKASVLATEEEERLCFPNQTARNIPDFLELKPMGLKTGLHVLAIIFENKRMGSSSRREVCILLYFEFTHVGLILNIYINFVHFLKLRACAYYQIHAAM